MAQAKRQGEGHSGWAAHLGRGLREGAMFILMAIGAYLLISLATYSPQDPSWSYTGHSDVVRNAGGRAGAWFSDVFLYLFGLFAYLFPVMVGYSGWLIFRERRTTASPAAYVIAVRWTGFLLTLVSGSALATMHLPTRYLVLPMDAGGILGQLTADGLIGVFSSTGGSLLLLAVFLTGITLFTGLSWLNVMDATGRLTLSLLARLGSLFTLRKWLRERLAARRAKTERKESLRREKKKTEKRAPPRIEPVIRAPAVPTVREEKERQVPLFRPAPNSELPPLSLLSDPKVTGKGYSTEALQAMSRQLELKLGDFGVEGTVVAVHPGPVITRFELQPAPGVKASKISGLSKDLARSLSTTSVRVVEVIPGKSVVGLEIPNETREVVYLKDVLKSSKYEKAGSPVSVALGKDIAGNPEVVDLARMPHLMVAGTTGSGKSVAINAMILSLVYKSTPRDVRLIMIDPKMLELSVYEGIPHLLAPVVTDMKEAANALRWCVGEMERRYRLMAALGVRNILGMNRKIDEARKQGRGIPDPMAPAPVLPLEGEGEPPPVPELEHLPYIVVVIDELADMMMVVGKKVEELIARLAQKARASGIHLILATQRPSVDVITGLIKANIPSRIAFQVSSRVDSRTIIDQMGAENLLGHGDMLYLAPGTGIPVRLHGAFVDDQEVHRVVEHLHKTGEPDYVEEITQEQPDSAGEFAGGADGELEDSDPLYDQAVRIVTETRRASISGVQRRLKIGYNRAARMIEEMERTGIVGPLESNGNREVLAPPPPED